MFTWSRVEIWFAVILAALIVVGGTGHLLLAVTQGQRAIVVEAKGDGPASSTDGAGDAQTVPGTSVTSEYSATNATVGTTAPAPVATTARAAVGGTLDAVVADTTTAADAPDRVDEPGSDLERARLDAAGSNAADHGVTRSDVAGPDIADSAADDPGSPAVDEETVFVVDERININTAQPSELQRLPGIGPALAARIVAYREAWGPFEVIEDILEVSGIGPVKFDNMKHMIKVN